jgi:DNA-binding response OmpR family regulator
LKKDILVIDDDPDLLELVRYNLELDGYGVSTAEDGLSGFALAQAERPDLILLDVTMEPTDGLQVLQHLRECPETRDITVMMLSAKRLVSQIDRAFGIGADDYITKPFDVEQLGAIIARKLTTAPEEK